MKTVKGRKEREPPMHLIESSIFTHAARVSKNTQRPTTWNAINHGVLREDDRVALDNQRLPTICQVYAMNLDLDELADRSHHRLTSSYYAFVAGSGV